MATATKPQASSSTASTAAPAKKPAVKTAPKASTGKAGKKTGTATAADKAFSEFSAAVDEMGKAGKRLPQGAASMPMRSAAELAKAIDSGAMVEIEFADGEKIMIPPNMSIRDLSEAINKTREGSMALRRAELAAAATRANFDKKKESSVSGLVAGMAALGFAILGYRVYKNGVAQVGSDMLDGAVAGGTGFAIVGGIIGMGIGGAEGYMDSEGKTATKRFAQTVGFALGGGAVGAGAYGLVGATAGAVTFGLMGSPRDLEVGGAMLEDAGGVALS